MLSHNILISLSPKVTPPQQSPSAQQAYKKHRKLGHLCLFSVLHTMHSSWEWRALICTKSLQVFYPHPMRCDKPTGAEQMPVKKLHQLPCAFVCWVFLARCYCRGKRKKKSLASKCRAESKSKRAQPYQERKSLSCVFCAAIFEISPEGANLFSFTICL